MTKTYWEDFAVGQMETYGNRTVTQEEIIEFATEFDPQSFHIDPEAAKDHFFGGLISSGWQTGSLQMRMMVDYQLKNSTSMGSPGVDELRWVSPVRPGETLSVTSEVLETTAHKHKSDRGIVQFRHTTKNEKGETKMYTVSRIMFGRRPTGEASQ
jgi:acyl dehydratase